MDTRKTHTEKPHQDNFGSYLAVVDDIPAMVCRFLKDGTLTYVNDAFCRFFRKRPQDLIGENFFKIIPEGDRAKVRESFGSLTKKKPTLTYEREAIASNGEMHWQSWTDKAIFDREENIVEYQSIGRDITSEKNKEQIITRKLQFQKTISDISSRFIGAQDINISINDSLSDLGRVNNVSRTYIFFFRENNTVMDNAYEWCALGVTREKDNLQNIQCSMFPWWMARLNRGEVINIEDTARFPYIADNEKEILERQGTKSILAVPLYLKGKLGGFIGLDIVGEIRKWDEDDISLLRIVSEIIGTAIERDEAQKSLQLSQETATAFCREILVLQEEEKRRISRDLHDETGQIVVGLGAGLNIMEKELKAGHIQEALNKIDENRKLVQDMSEKIKSLARFLRPPALDVLGLSAVLREYFWQCSQSNPIRIEFNENMKDTKLNENLEITVYRIVQEAIYNILKHAKANVVKVELVLKNEHLRLVIADDGKGFNAEENKDKFDSAKLGLRGIKERVDILDGTFSIKSEHGTGTRIEVVLPVLYTMDEATR